MTKHDPPKPIHVQGAQKGEELVRNKGHEPGRGERDVAGYRSSRDSTGIDSKGRRPIDPAMPNMPPV
jgi:hypothetical protein